jgi:hypothetical protein
MIYPGFAGRAARPSGGLFRFWAVILLNPNQLGIPPAKAGEVKFRDPASAAGEERRPGQRTVSASDLDRTDYGRSTCLHVVSHTVRRVVVFTGQ